MLAAAAAGGEEGEEDGEVSTELLEVVPKSLEGFDAGMNDDLNTPRYMGTTAVYIKILAFTYFLFGVYVCTIAPLEHSSSRCYLYLALIFGKRKDPGTLAF